MHLGGSLIECGLTVDALVVCGFVLCRTKYMIYICQDEGRRFRILSWKREEYPGHILHEGFLEM